MLGKNQADVDLILTHLTIGETAWVQIKPQAAQVQLEDYLDRYRRDGSCDRFFFICHSALGALSLPAEPGLHLWTAEYLADAAIRTWLFDWLLDRTR